MTKVVGRDIDRAAVRVQQHEQSRPGEREISRGEKLKLVLTRSTANAKGTGFASGNADNGFKV